VSCKYKFLLPNPDAKLTAMNLHSLISFPSCVMIKNHNLFITRGRACNFQSRSIVLGFLHRVDIDNFSISFISEQKPGIAVGRVHLKVGTIVGDANPGVPVIVTQIIPLWQELFLFFKVRFEILRLQSMGVVNVSTGFYFLNLPKNSYP
jgi:hypothetical protein